MNYVLADEGKVRAAGFSMTIHQKSRDGRVIMTEKEVLTSPLLHGTPDERVKALGGEVIGGGTTHQII